MSKKELSIKKNKHKLYKYNHTCKICNKFCTDNKLYYDYRKEKIYYCICNDCYKKIYNLNKEKFIHDLLNKKIIFIDVETTGLGENDEILQISIIDQNNITLINEYCKPEHITNWPEAASINNIYQKDVKDCYPYDYYKSKVHSIIDEPDIIVGYNTQFDLSFIRCRYSNKKIIDIMPYFANVYGEWNDYYKNYTYQSLLTCADYYDYNLNSAHNSLEDAKATLHCYPRVFFDYYFDIYQYI